MTINAAVIDIGGGTSRLVDASIELGFPNQVDRDAYLCALNGGTASGSVAVFTTFSPDGPTQCSGLPVQRHSLEQIAEPRGARWQLESAEPNEHTTTAETVQPGRTAQEIADRQPTNRLEAARTFSRGLGFR